MAQARPLLFGAVLLALALPGHPLAPLSGLPLDLPALCVLVLTIGWWISLPGVPTRAGAVAAAFLVLGLVKVAIWWGAPAYGLDGIIVPIETESVDLPDAPPSRRGVDLALDFQGDTFPVHFFNDIRSFNFYTPSQPKRDLLPFEATWRGLLVVAGGGDQSLTLEANGPALLEIGTGELGTGQRVAIEQAGRVRDVTLKATLPSGLVPITVTYRRPDEAMPWLVVRNGPADANGSALAGGQLVRAGTSAATVARDVWLRPLAWVVDGLLVGVMALAAGAHVLSVVRRSRAIGASPVDPAEPIAARSSELAVRPGLALSERALLAVYVVAAVGAALLSNLPLFGRAIILSGGNDWLAYEGFARDILLNGPLLTEGRPLEQGVPFYYQPLYIYWIALSHLALGESLFAPLFMNAVLGIAAGVGLYLLARDLFGRAAGVVAVILLEVCRRTVFAQTAGLLLSENLLLPLVPVFLLLLARLARSAGLRTTVAAGVALGLAGLARTTPLAILPPTLLILLFAWRRRGLPLRMIGGRLALLVLVCTLTVGLATTRNYLVSGRPVPITSSAGANLWETHRPSSNVDLSRIDRDPLYERLGLDRQTREVVEFARQDPGGYVGTLIPMFLYAVGVIGAVDGRWDVQPIFFTLSLAYLVSTLLVGRARAVPTWFLHVFVLSHLAQMTVFFSNQYGFRLILPMYIGMVPVVAAGLVAAATLAGRLLAPMLPRVQARRDPRSSGRASPVARVLVVMIALIGGAGALGAGGWRGQEVAREAFYGLNGDAALATRQAVRTDLMRRADATYFVGDDSRSTDVAYLSGLAYPALRWFDGARGLVLPPVGAQALYVVPDRAAADLAKRCLGDGVALAGEQDEQTGAGLALYLTDAGASGCGAPREPIRAAFAEGVDPTARLVGLDGPASVEPGRALDVMISWEALGRPRNRARPFVRLVDSRGRRWGQAETTVYPSSSWRPGERAIGLAKLDVDPTLPPGEYHLEGGFSAGSATERLSADGAWGSAGLAAARGPAVRLVSRSTPLAVDALPLDRKLDAQLDGARLIGVDVDRDDLRAGERARVSLFWQASVGSQAAGEVSLLVREPGGRAVREWRGQPVDGTYPSSVWKPGEIVRDTWDIVVPPTAPEGPLELATTLVTPSGSPGQYVSLGTLTVQAGDRQLTEPDLRARLGSRFVGGAELVGVDYKGRRARAGDTVDLTLVWRAGAPIPTDQAVTVAVLDEAGRVLAQQESEPAGNKRPTSGWTTDEYIEDGWKIRLPRELPRGRVRLAVSLVDPTSGLRVPTEGGGAWVDLPIEVGSE
jgi:hypothetical protein